MTWLSCCYAPEKRTLIPRDWSKVYHIVEKTKTSLKLKSSFPFFEMHKEQVTSFKFRTVYTTMNSFSDPRYKVKCGVLDLAKLFRVENVVPFERSIVESDMYE